MSDAQTRRKPARWARTRTPLSPERRARALRSRLVWSAGVAPLVVVLLWFAWPMVVAGPAVRSAAHTTAGDRSGYFWLDAVADHDAVELWRADYNSGTVRLLAGEGWAAVGPLRRALAAVPEVKEDQYAQYCMVLDNLVLAYAAQAEHTTDPDVADRAVADAVQLLKDPRCSDQDDTPHLSQPSPQNRRPDGQGGQGDDEAEQERQRELEERQRDADADAEQFRQGGTPDLMNPGGGRAGGDGPGGHQDW
ncbi:MAG: hypothetical protein FWH11_08010 [Micrococcales bacterium]|nr:hypothetical protein [Micrococcales bacterium]